MQQNHNTTINRKTMRATEPINELTPAAEARRYVENARTLLIEKAKLDPETQFYRDRKYVRMAGNTLWNGVLLILDATFSINNKSKGRPSIKDYRILVGNRDKKLLTYVNAAYDTMHLAMGYDGNLRKSVSQDGLLFANEIIDRCESILE